MSNSDRDALTSFVDGICEEGLLATEKDFVCYYRARFFDYLPPKELVEEFKYYAMLYGVYGKE